MKSSNKIFIAALGLVLAGTINNASAQINRRAAPATPEVEENKIENPAVLFKIHDIKPVTTTEGQISSCDFAVTFYNRSNENINGASLDLTWEDTAIQNFSKQDANKNQRSSSRTTTDTVSLNIEVPSIKSMQQATIRTRLQSDRCFLLLEDAKSRVRSCNLASQARASSRGATVCSSLFKFVSSKDPEYYVEFSNVSAEQMKAMKDEENASIKRELNEEYAKTVAEFEKASQLLKEIR